MPMVGLFSALNISATGLRAQRVRQNVIASNLANAETTRTEEGGPYRKQSVVLTADPTEVDQRFIFGPEKMPGMTSDNKHMRIPDPEFPIDEERIGSGVTVDAIVQDDSPPRLVHDPSHPDANEEGYVAMPNVNVVEEMVAMITATRSYEASVTAMNATKSMLMKALEI